MIKKSMKKRLIKYIEIPIVSFANYSYLFKFGMFDIQTTVLP